ncbi:MAG: metal ABC transporter permease [bacterium]|nr:metal ABC transporter permease [bacterium]
MPALPDVLLQFAAMFSTEVFRESFLRYALFAGLLAGSVCAFLGVYVILRRIVFLGVALSEAAALGVALGLFVGWNAEAAAFGLTLLTALLFSLSGRYEALSKESLIGWAYVVAAGVSIILIAKNPAAEAHGLDVVSGTLLYSSKREIWQLGCVAGVVFLTFVSLHRMFIFVSFDKETARSMGLRTSLYELAFYACLGLSISLAMKTAGILFVFASLLIPAMISLTLFRQMWLILLGSVLVVLLSVPAGISLSFRADLPTGPAIVCVYAALFLLVSFGRAVHSLAR